MAKRPEAVQFDDWKGVWNIRFNHITRKIGELSNHPNSTAKHRAEAEKIKKAIAEVLTALGEYDGKTPSQRDLGKLEKAYTEINQEFENLAYILRKPPAVIHLPDLTK